MKRDKRKENFDRWFKGSQVIDTEDKPLVMYHGSNTLTNKVTGSQFWVTPCQETAAYMGGKKRKTHSVYVHAKNVFDGSNATHVGLVEKNFDSTFKNGTFSNWRERIVNHWKIWDDSRAVDIVAKAGFDAISSNEEGVDTLLLIGGVEGRVKSAKKNKGTYDPGDPDITDGFEQAALEAKKYLNSLHGTDAKAAHVA